MPKISDPWDHHDWDSRSYVSQWAERQDGREMDRAEVFRLMAKILPYDREAPIRILDVGAGYGALAKFLLECFPNATAVCQDGSEEMAKLGRKRINHLKGRFEYFLCDFSKEGWSRIIKGPFEAVVSAIAIHNVRLPDTIRAIYEETFTLMKAGGCFLNFDRMRPSQKEQLRWLKEAGYKDVKCFWDGGKRALVGGFKK
jgi:tRNA (cmo5U34)-methyltransferase